MIFDTALKLLRLPVVDDTLTGLGYPRGLGVSDRRDRGDRPGRLPRAAHGRPRRGALYRHLRRGLSRRRCGWDRPFSRTCCFGVYLGVLAWGRVVVPRPAAAGDLPLPHLTRCRRRPSHDRYLDHRRPRTRPDPSHQGAACSGLSRLDRPGTPHANGSRRCPTRLRTRPWMCARAAPASSSCVAPMATSFPTGASTWKVVPG